MARQPRIEYPGAIHHVYARGNARADIFRDDVDRARFLQLLDEVIASNGWRCHAYCLMGNHYHLAIETPEQTLSVGMRQLGGVYTQWFNARHLRVGHVFQGRFKSSVVERERYFRELCRYIVLNPVRAGLCRTADEWEWSSYRAMVGESSGVTPRLRYFHTDLVHTEFYGASGFRDFVASARDGRGSEDEAFRSSVTAIGRPKQVLRPALAELFSCLRTRRARRREDLRVAVAAATAKHGYSKKEVASFLEVSPSRISQLLAADRVQTKVLVPDPKT